MIYTFYTHTPGQNPEFELRLLTLWRAHHEALGIETKVLGEYQAAKMETYPQFDEAITRIAGNGPGRPTFMRWLALAKVAGGRGVMMDYDVFLYPQVWADLNPVFHLSGADVQTLRIYQGYRPSLVIGTDQTFLHQAMRFASCLVTNAMPDITDESILKIQAEKLPESLTCLSFVQDYGTENWQNAVAVKYRRELMPQGTPLHVAIPNLRKQVVPQ